MGSQTFNFLTDSFLFNNNVIAYRFSDFSEQELLSELNNYREFCISRQSELEQEISTNTSSLKVVSGLEMPTIGLLKQSAFYINQYVINDPVFSFGHRENEFSKVLKHSQGINEEPLDRKKLSEIVSYMKQLTPMVTADYVKFLPINHFLETPEQLPILYSEKLFSDVLPEPLIEFFHKNVIVNSLERASDNPQAINLKRLQPCREIMFRFKNHINRHYGYILYKSDFSLLDEQKSKFQVSMQLAKDIPDRDTFINWVDQSFYLSCKQIYDEVAWKTFITSRYDASYLTESKFIFDLLSQFFPLENGIPTNTANIFLNMELPFLEQVEISALMEIRMNYGEEFQNFRLHLDKQFKDLRLIKNPEKLKIKAENAMHELNEVQIHAINQKISQIRKTSAVFDAIILSGSLLAAIQGSDWSVAGLSTVLATAARGYKPFIDYSNQIRQNPAFFLWKILKKSAR